MKLKIKTQRLSLRLLEFEDIGYLDTLHSDPEVVTFFPGGVKSRAQTSERIAEFISYYQNQGIPNFMIFSLESDEFIGRCGFGLLDSGEIEVGYVLHKKFWGQGYATELLVAMLAWAQTNLKTDQVIAITPVNHIASQKVLRKGKMVFYKNGVALGIQCCFYRIEIRS